MSDLSKKIFKSSKHYVTSKFGWRIHPITKEKKFHSGCDYGTSGKKVNQYAVEDGKVLSAGTDGVGGKYAWVEYPRMKVKVLHYHLDSVKVKKGQKVKEGTLVGTTGRTGRATGVHLHLGLYDLVKKRYIDPDVFKIPKVVKVDSTREYVKKYQRLANALKWRDSNGKALRVDGYYGELSREAMSGHNLEVRSQNIMVGLAQEMLKKLGYYKDGLDNDFYVLTEKAVKAFQKDSKLKVDGIIGQDTMGKLLEKM